RCIIRRVVDDAEVAQLPKSKDARWVSFGPGLLLADYGGPATGVLRVWDLAGPEPALLIEEIRDAQTWDFRPDGHLIAIMRRDGSLSSYELPSGKLLNLVLPRALREPTIRLHPSAPLVAVMSYWHGHVDVCNLNTGEIDELRPPWPDGRAASGAWTRD